MTICSFIVLWAILVKVERSWSPTRDKENGRAQFSDSPQTFTSWLCWAMTNEKSRTAILCSCSSLEQFWRQSSLQCQCFSNWKASKTMFKFPPSNLWNVFSLTTGRKQQITTKNRHFDFVKFADFEHFVHVMTIGLTWIFGFFKISIYIDVLLTDWYEFFTWFNWCELRENSCSKLVVVYAVVSCEVCDVSREARVFIASVTS